MTGGSRDRAGVRGIYPHRAVAHVKRDTAWATGWLSGQRATTAADYLGPVVVTPCDSLGGVHITPRSLQVFASALRYGKRVSAQRFGISEYGVKFHTRQVYAALGLEPQDGGRLDGGLAIEAAIQLGWLRIPAEFA